MPVDGTSGFSQPNRSVLAGIECLQWLAMSERALGTREMGRLMGIDPTRASRLLNSLALAGIARKTPDRKFTVGSGFHVLSAQSLHASGILRVALPTLTRLCERPGTIALGVLWKDRVSYLFHRSRTRSVSESIGSVGSYPASASSLGIVLLAEQPEAHVAALYADAPPPPFANLAGLQAELALTRERGFSRRPSSTGAISEAAGIRHGEEIIAALGMTDMPLEISEEKRLSTLFTAAKEIEAGLEV